MILTIGDPADPVIRSVRAILRDGGHEGVLLNASNASQYSLRSSAAGPGASLGWSIVGGECRGERAVGAVLVRRGPLAGTAHRDPASLGARLDRMLLRTTCHVINRPSACAGNYAKVHQLVELAAAGFAVPCTLVTSIPRAALQFIASHQGRVLIKGLSSVKTVPEAVGPRHLRMLDQLAQCPALLQEIVDGVDVRLTVIGGQAIASVGGSAGPARNSDACDALPPQTVRRCIAFTRRAGLVLSGFDLRLAPGGHICVLEMNTNPLVTHYETAENPVISRALCAELLANAGTAGDILV